VDVRLGTHPDYDRLVIELDAETDVVLEPGDGVGIALWLDATTETPRRRLESSLPRIASVVLEETPDGLEVRLLAPVGRVRAFALRQPFRVVVDVADAGAQPFVAPAGTLPVPERLPEPEPVSEPVPVEEPAQVEEPALVEQPAPVEEPAPAEEPEEPVLGEGLPDRPAPRASTAEPSLSESERPLLDVDFDVDRDTLQVALWVLFALAVAVVVLVTIGRRRRSVRPREPHDEWPDEPRASESIRPDEILAAADRVDVLEKRIDQEVRARTHVEERVSELQEDLKVLRDRLNRSRSDL
jgi:hypothetical protein